MKTISIEGIATFSKNGFSFNSGLPCEETLVKEQKMHGTMKVSPNGCAEFKNRNCVYMPPLRTRILTEELLKVNRTTRHYIIQMKVPVIESHDESKRKLMEMLPNVISSITKDRKGLIGEQS